MSNKVFVVILMIKMETRTELFISDTSDASIFNRYKAKIKNLTFLYPFLCREFLVPFDEYLKRTYPKYLDTLY